MTSVIPSPERDNYGWFLEPKFRIEGTPIMISNGVYFVWQIRPDLQELFDIDAHRGSLEFYGWWLFHGSRQYGGLTFKLSHEELAYLNEPSDSIEQDCEEPISRALDMIWSSSEQLKSQFDRSSKQGREGFLRWWARNGRKERDQLAGLDAGKNSAQEEDPATITTVLSGIDAPNGQSGRMGRCHSGGINIAGFAFGELGLGEDVRMAAAAMQTGRVPCRIYNVPTHLLSRAQDTRAMDLIEDEPFYAANIIFLPGVETARLFLENGPGLFKGRYNIGAWQWELPNWPPGLHTAYRLVDEIWASSRYTAESFRKSAPVEVLHMPMAVNIETKPTLKRHDFGLSEDCFIFIFFFDCYSSFSRKNPLAAIEAFLLAFSEAEEGVRLVIKCMNANSGHAVWNRILALCDKDHRISAINESFPRDRIIGLLNVCDVLISLHRSEGFGRTMAEAMLLGKPVIATNYSGNTDFTNNRTAFLVDGPLKEVGPDDYMFGTGQFWCDPDVEQAADHMRTCFEDRQLASRIAKAGQAFILENYSPVAVGNAYRRRLEHLGIVSTAGP